MDGILHFDWSIFAWTERAFDVGSNPVLDGVMKTITSLGDGGVIWIILAVVMLLFKKTRLIGIAMLIGAAFSGIFTDLVIKPLIDRARPFNIDWTPYGLGEFFYPNIIEKPDSLSFPSGHTSSSFGSAMALWFLKDKKLRYALAVPGTILAALIGFSRIYVHVHYPTDVIAGVIVGTIYALAAVLIVNAIAKALRKAGKGKIITGD
jgi:undecaprenyl-diphosphatase